MEILLAILALLGIRAATAPAPAPEPPEPTEPTDPDETEDVRATLPLFERDGVLYNLLGQRVGDASGPPPDNLYELSPEFVAALEAGDGRYVRHPNTARWWIRSGVLSRHLYETPPHLLIFFQPYTPRSFWTLPGGSQTQGSGVYSTDGHDFYVYARQSEQPFWIEFKIIGRLVEDGRWVVLASQEWTQDARLAATPYLYTDAYNGVTLDWPTNAVGQFDQSARPVIPF